MTSKQTALINQAAKQEVGGEQWRDRMDAWLDERPLTAKYFTQVFSGMWAAQQEARRKDIQIINECLGINYAP